MHVVTFLIWQLLKESVERQQMLQSQIDELTLQLEGVARSVPQPRSRDLLWLTSHTPCPLTTQRCPRIGPNLAGSRFPDWSYFGRLEAPDWS